VITCPDVPNENSRKNIRRHLLTPTPGKNTGYKAVRPIMSATLQKNMGIMDKNRARAMTRRGEGFHDRSSLPECIPQRYKENPPSRCVMFFRRRKAEVRNQKKVFSALISF
jgi:hypothetical protein